MLGQVEILVSYLETHFKTSRIMQHIMNLPKSDIFYLIARYYFAVIDMETIVLTLVRNIS